MTSKRLRILAVVGCLSFSSAPEMPLWADVVVPNGADRDRTESERERRRKIEKMEGNMGEENRIPTIASREFKVDRGETITIELQTIGDTDAQAVHYIIKDEPLAGTLSEVRFLDISRSRAEVDYTAVADSNLPSDRFSFSAQYPNGRVSAPQTVRINIVQPKPALVAPANLDFGKTMMGQQSTIEVELENEGNYYFEGEFKLDGPFFHALKPGEPRKIRIDPGESKTVTFGFRPSHQGLRMHRMSFPASKEGSIRFTGEGYVPFTLGGPELELVYDPETRSRRGILNIRGNETPGVRLAVTTGERLFIWGGQKYWLEGSDLVSMVMQLASTDTAAFEGEILVSAGGYERKVQVRSEPSPAHLVLTGHPIIDFGKIEIGSEGTHKLVVSNLGGQDGTLVCPDFSPFTLKGDNRSLSPISVPANESVEIELAFRPLKPERFQRSFKLDAGGQELLIIVEGEGMTPKALAEFIDLRTEDSSAYGSVGIYAEQNFNHQGQSGSGLKITPRVNQSGQVVSPLARSSYYEQLAKARQSQLARPLTAEDLRRQDLAREIDASVTGEIGKIPLPVTLARDGMLAFSPYKKKTDPTLPRISRFGVIKSKPTTVNLVFRTPTGKDFSEYALEMRITRANPEKRRYEAVWIPYHNVKFIDKGELVVAELFGLKPDAYYLMRLFTMGENGTNSLPSEEFGTRTPVGEMSLGMQMLIGLIALIIVSSGGMMMYLKQTGLA